MQEGFANLLNLTGDELEAQAQAFVDTNHPLRADVITSAGAISLAKAGVEADKAEEPAEKDWVVQAVRATRPPAPPPAEPMDIVNDDEEQGSSSEDEAEFDIGALLEKIKTDCVAPQQEEQAVIVPIMPNNATMQYIQHFSAFVRRFPTPTPSEAFRTLLYIGVVVATSRNLMSLSWKQIGLLLGMVKPQSHSTVKRASVLYNLIVQHHMHKLLFFQPGKKTLTTQLLKHADAIVQFLAGHPLEAAWWSQNPLPMIDLPDKNGQMVQWPNLQL